MLDAIRRFGFSAAHRYWRTDWSGGENQRVFDPYSNPYGHGHNYTAEVSLGGPVDAATSIVIELEQMDATAHAVLDRMHLRHLDRELPAFAEQPSTVENIVVYLWNEQVPRFEGRLRRRMLWETKRNLFTYAGPTS